MFFRNQSGSSSEGPFFLSANPLAQYFRYLPQQLSRNRKISQAIY